MLLDYKKRQPLWEALNAKDDLKEFLGPLYKDEWFSNDIYYGQTKELIDLINSTKGVPGKENDHDMYHVASVVAYNDKQQAKIKHFCQLYDTLTNYENVTGQTIKSVLDYGGGIGTDVFMCQIVGLGIENYHLADLMGSVRREFIQFRAKKYGYKCPTLYDVKDALPKVDVSWSFFALEYEQNRKMATLKFAETSDTLIYATLENDVPIKDLFGDGKGEHIQVTLERMGYKRLKNKPYYPKFFTNKNIEKLY